MGLDLPGLPTVCPSSYCHDNGVCICDTVTFPPLTLSFPCIHSIPIFRLSSSYCLILSLTTVGLGRWHQQRSPRNMRQPAMSVQHRRPN